MQNPDYYYDNGHPRFIGFIPDLMREIADLTGMNYVIMTSPDNNFGYRQNDGNWDGMIGELLRQVQYIEKQAKHRRNYYRNDYILLILRERLSLVPQIIENKKQHRKIRI
jgi:hypothetical protein